MAFFEKRVNETPDPLMPGVKFNDVEHSIGKISMQSLFKKKSNDKNSVLTKNADDNLILHIAAMETYEPEDGEHPWEMEDVAIFEQTAANIAGLLNDGNETEGRTIEKYDFVGTPDNQMLKKGGAK